MDGRIIVTGIPGLPLKINVVVEHTAVYHFSYLEGSEKKKSRVIEFNIRSSHLPLHEAQNLLNVRVYFLKFFFLAKVWEFQLPPPNPP